MLLLSSEAVVWFGLVCGLVCGLVWVVVWFRLVCGLVWFGGLVLGEQCLLMFIARRNKDDLSF